MRHSTPDEPAMTPAQRKRTNIGVNFFLVQIISKHPVSIGFLTEIISNLQ